MTVTRIQPERPSQQLYRHPELAPALCVADHISSLQRRACPSLGQWRSSTCRAAPLAKTWARPSLKAAYVVGDAQSWGQFRMSIQLLRGSFRLNARDRHD